MLFLSGRDSGLVFSRWVHYQLVLRFAMSVFSPWDQRGKSGSRNRELDSGSGLKIGLSGILGFAWNESRHVNSRGAFPTAHVLVNLLKEEPVKGFPTLVTGHLSRLVSGLERRLLHRSVAHYQSTYS